jgi:acetyl-CoA carboxylase biotin carboxyl carrier protein
MNTGDLDRLLQLMLEERLSHVSYSDGVLEISMTLAEAENSGVAEIPDVVRTEPVMLCSRTIGTLLAAHPTRPGDTAKTGDQVIAGQPVADVQSGYSLSAVTAERSGVLGRQLGEYGRIVGYGAPVFELFPDASVEPEKG